MGRCNERPAVATLVRRTPLLDRSARHPAGNQLCLDRFWRHAAQQIASALATQAACARWFGLPGLDLRSPLITGLSLSLLLGADTAWLFALAGVIAIGSKFLLRLDGKHIFNPAGFAIIALLFAAPGVWISPGQWGTSIWFAALRSWCCRRRAVPTLQSSFSGATPRSCSRAPGGWAIRSPSHCISCRAVRC